MERKTRIQQRIEDMTGITRYETPVTSWFSNPEEVAFAVTDVYKVFGRTYAILRHRIAKDEKKGTSFELINMALRYAAAINALHNKPRKVYMFTPSGSVAVVDVYYEPAPDGSGKVIPQSRSHGHWEVIYSLDDFWEQVALSGEDHAPLIVVPPGFELLPYGENPKPEYPEPLQLGESLLIRILEKSWRLRKLFAKVFPKDFAFYASYLRPYGEIARFSGKVYDGSLPYPELDEFKGITFGNGEWSYWFSAKEQGKNLGISGALKKLPRPGYPFSCAGTDYEVIRVRHKSFEKDEHFVTKEPYFTQRVVLELKYLKSERQLSSAETNNKVLTDDLVRFASIAARQDLELELIKPEYYDKSPVTPWYRAYDPYSGAIIVMGWRWRVNEVSIRFPKEIPAATFWKELSDVNATESWNFDWYGEPIGQSNATGIKTREEAVQTYMLHCSSDEETAKRLAALLRLARGYDLQEQKYQQFLQQMRLNPYIWDENKYSVSSFVV